jgi:integrase
VDDHQIFLAASRAALQFQRYAGVTQKGGDGMEMELREGIAKQIAVPKGCRDVLVWDTKTPGFFLRVFPSGRAMWGVRYHVAGKQRRVHLYDAVVRGTLAKARNEAADVRAKARLGTDVVAERAAAAQAKARTVTLGKVAERYLADRREARRPNGELAWRPRYLIEVERQLTNDWAPLAATAIKAVTRQSIVDVIDDIAVNQGRVAADRARTALGGLFAWAIDSGYADATPVLHIKSRAMKGARNRTLTPEELKEVWLAADAIGGDYAVIVKMLVLSGQRRDEIGSLAWSEIDFNTMRIDLPEARTKNHKRHLVPLSAEALAVLPPGPDNPERIMVFGRLGTGFSGWSKAKRELDATIAATRKERRAKPMPAWRIHDLRRTFVTMVNEQRLAPPHVVEAIVNHISGAKGGVAGVYNHALYLEERTQTLAAWGRFVRELVDKAPVNTCVSDK